MEGKMNHYFEWPTFTLRADGVLVYDNGEPLQVRSIYAPEFKDAAEAEAWLVANDVRGNVR
jgi:hypothetical protein